MNQYIFLLIISLFVDSDNPIEKLRLNQIQVIGSHNSYKQAIDPNLFSMLKKLDSTSFKKIEYSHLSLSEQLSLGLLNLEIDIYADTKGGKYANPKGLGFVKKQAPYDNSNMKESGFKVLHMQDIDFRSNCATFKLCLLELKKWSDDNKNHLPIFITMNAKDDEIKIRKDFDIPEKFTSEHFDELDKIIIETLGAEKVLTPDQVRSKYKTLEDAVLKQKWPIVKKCQGKFIFILDEVGEKRENYIKNHVSLRARVLFTNSEPGTPEAAIIIRNNPKSGGIKDLVKKGYIIRTRADADTNEARANDKSSFEAACNSGAQIITTDYYMKSTHFKSEYEIAFKNNTYVRENPVLK